ncbi:hypothetical protein ACFL2O_06380 [Thermodesulfobacteriota bacterium]
MKNLKISLIDNDSVVNAETNLKFRTNAGSAFMKFISEIEEELATGKIAYLEVDGLSKGPVTFSISNFG